MAVLFFTEQTKKDIERLIKNAEDNIFDVSKLNRIQEGVVRPPGDNEKYFCQIGTVKVVYTIEEHDETHRYRHLSLSTIGTGKYPSVELCEYIMKEFGFEGGIHDQVNVWTEDRVEAVNILGEFKK